MYEATRELSKKPRTVLRWLRGAGIGLALAAILPGCMAHGRGEIVYNHEVEYVDDAPARVEYYPSTYYHGRPAYLVEGRWYYRSGPRWVVFRDEPVELREYRVRRAPAYRQAPVYGRTYAPSESRTYRRADERRAVERRAELRRAEERRAADHHADVRRAEERRAKEHRADQRRAEERRDAERRAAERRDAERRAAEHRAAERRDDRQRAAERRAEERHPEADRRGPQPRARNTRSDRSRRQRDDDRDERRQRNN